MGIDRLLVFTVQAGAFIAILAAANPAAAGHESNPEVVTAEQLIELAGADGRLKIIDARIAGDRRFGYIEGSISLPDTATDCRTLRRINPDKATPLLFYCNGVKCRRSIRAITKAKRCGYTALYWFRGGFEEWKSKGYPFLKE